MKYGPKAFSWFEWYWSFYHRLYFKSAITFFVFWQKCGKFSTGFRSSENHHWRHCQCLILVHFEESFSETCFENYRKMINSTITLNKTTLKAKILVRGKVGGNVLWRIWRLLYERESCLFLNFDPEREAFFFLWNLLTLKGFKFCMNQTLLSFKKVY